jgi:hypothetical protein
MSTGLCGRGGRRLGKLRVNAFTQAGDEDSVFPIRHFYQRWGAAIAIERRPSVAAERALADPDLLSGTRQPGKPPRLSRRPTARSRVADWLTDIRSERVVIVQVNWIG